MKSKIIGWSLIATPLLLIAVAIFIPTAIVTPDVSMDDPLRTLNLLSAYCSFVAVLFGIPMIVYGLTIVLRKPERHAALGEPSTEPIMLDVYIADSWRERLSGPSFFEGNSGVLEWNNADKQLQLTRIKDNEVLQSVAFSDVEKFTVSLGIISTTIKGKKYSIAPRSKASDSAYKAGLRYNFGAGAAVAINTAILSSPKIKELYARLQHEGVKVRKVQGSRALAYGLIIGWALITAGFVYLTVISLR